MGGKSSSETVGYKQYAGASLVLAQLVHKIKNIKIGDNQAWAGSLDSEGTISIDKPKLFGSSGTEGGFIGDIQFQPGLPDQMPNAYLLSKIGPDISANRGVSQVVLPQPYLGNNPYIKDFEFECERIHLLSDGSVQWYDEKAAITNKTTAIPNSYADWKYKLVLYTDTTDYSTVDDSAWDTGGAPFGNNYTGVPSTYPHDFGFSDTPVTATSTNQFLWLHTQISLNDVLNDLTLEVYIDNALEMWVNGVKVVTAYVPAAFHGVLSIAASHFRSGVNDIAFKCYDTFPGTTDPHTNRSYFDMKVYDTTQTIDDINPAHLLRECLTNPEFGYGYDEEDIDDVAFKAAADQLYTENFGIGYFWEDSSTQLEDIIEKVEEIIDGNLYVDRDTLKWTLTLVRNDYDPDTLPALSTDAEVISISEYSRPEFLDLINHVTVNYYNSAIKGNGSVSASNSALFLQQGVRLSVTKDFDMCSSSELASVLLQRELNVVSTPFSSCKVLCNSAAKNFKRGTVFKLTSPRHNYNQTIMRVTGIKRGDNTTKQITLTVVEDKFGLPSVAFVEPEPPAWTDPANNPMPIADRIAIEVPYAFLLGHDTQTNIDASLAADPDLGYFGIAGARVPGANNAAIFADSGAGFKDVALLDFCPYGELSADLDYLTNSMTLVNYEDFSELIAGAVGIIDGELISFTSNASGVFTGVKRAIFDTVPTKHAAGSKVFFIQNYLDGPETQYADGESVDIKLATNAALGQLNLGAAPTDTVAFASRAIKPYPPGALKLNATAYPSTITGALTVTWAHRNRVSQADTIVDTTQASITPEVNTRYTLQFYDATAALIIERTNIGPATAGVVLNYTGDVTLVLWAVSDNGASLQKHSFTFAYTPPGGTTISSITATDYVSVDDSTIIDGGQI